MGFTGIRIQVVFRGPDVGQWRAKGHYHTHESDMKTASAAGGSDAPDEMRRLFLKARKAHELGNHDYAIAILRAVLKVAPGFESAGVLLKVCERARDS